MIEFAIGLGVILNLVSYELIGLTAGGAVIPGYLALFLDQPGRIASTFAAAGVTLLAAKLLGRVTILYGRRRFTVMLLVGFFVHGLFNAAAPWLSGLFGSLQPDVRVIGFIVPGLLANEMQRQGVVPTTGAALIAAVVVRIAVALIIRAGWVGGA